MSEIPDEMTFEKALEKLEALVGNLEEGDVPLTTLVEKFEEGNKLIKLCEDRLKSAELKIEKLREEKESIALEAFQPDLEDESQS